MFFIYLLTVVLVIDCVILVLLVLVQLPKKEAGMGQAFGGAATDALFGAGSGNVLTKMTKWGAGIFFALAIALTVMGTYKTTSGTGRLPGLLGKTRPTSTLPTAATPAPAPTTTNNILNLNLTNTTVPSTNAAPAATNAGAK